MTSIRKAKAVTANLKSIYQSPSEEAARAEPEYFAQTWDEKYLQISKSWSYHWGNLMTFFNYPQDIRKAIYMANAIESLNSVIRKSVRAKKVFSSNEADTKVVYLAIQGESKRWTMPIGNWQ